MFFKKKTKQKVKIEFCPLAEKSQVKYILVNFHNLDMEYRLLIKNCFCKDTLLLFCKSQFSPA